ncbi:MAG: TonB-dependent receptor [Acidobacteriaceae bacterium]
MSINPASSRSHRSAWDVLWTVGLLVLITAGLCSRSFAQTDTGRIVGTVTDPTGAAISGATVTVTNQANGLKFSAIANAAGQFNIFAVPRGTYLAKIDAQGFASQAQTFDLAVTQVQTLLFKLQPGAVNVTVKVTDAAPLIDASNATLGETIQGKQITQLPLNGRNFTNLALLAPGVTRGAYGTEESGVNGNSETFRYNESGGAALSVNGLRPQANNYILDGVDNNDGLINTILFFPPIDATQEFKIDTSVAPAQFGRAGGAIVVSSIRSGTNSIHGSAFEFYRSGKWDSNPDYRFQGAAASPNPAYNRNQFGGSVGLPIIKDKLFAFGDYSGWRESLPINPSFVTVPTAKMRTGDFSELLDPAYNAQTHSNLCQPAGVTSTDIFDPISCLPFAYNGNPNVIPPNRLNAAALNYLNAYPSPTLTTKLEQNYETHEASTVKYNDFDIRLDWHPTQSDIAFFRYSYSNDAQTKTSEFPNLPAGFGTGSNFTHARGYDLGYTHIFTPNIVNELRLAYNRDNYGYQPPFYGVPVSANLGIVNANRNQETSGGALIGGYGSELEYTGDYGLYSVPQNTYELTDTLNWQRGPHSFKFGGTFIRRQVNYFRPIAGKGFFNISGNGQDFTGYEVSDVLSSFMDNYSIGAQSGFFGNISQEDGVFAQDDWRVNARLTLNLGIRWDLLTWPYEMHNRQAAFDINTGTVLEADQNGVSRSIINQNYHNFAPRVGFAYDVRGDGKLVLRGGYGIYYFPDYGGISNQLGQQPPFGGSVDYLAKNGYCIAFTGQTAQGTGFDSCKVGSVGVANPLPAPGFPNFNPAAPPQGLSINSVDQNNKNSQIQQWDLQLEQQLTSKDTFDIAYVGTKADHLSTYYPYNIYQFGTGVQNYPNLGSITYNIYSGTSNYNGLQVHAEHRETNLIATFSYTWSHTLDDSPGADQGSTAPLYYDPHADYGNSAQDQRNVFSASFVYNFPFGQGQRFGGNVSRPMDWAIGGWQTNLIALVASGQPFDLQTGQTNSPNRPDQVSLLDYPKSISGYWFSPSTFSGTTIPQFTPRPGIDVYTRLGTARRNQVYGPGQRVVNFGLQKNLHLYRDYTLELHGDAFNVFNTPQFTNPDANVHDANFGKILATQQFSNRQIQLAARFVF